MFPSVGDSGGPETLLLADGDKPTALEGDSSCLIGDVTFGPSAFDAAVGYPLQDFSLAGVDSPLGHVRDRIRAVKGWSCSATVSGPDEYAEVGAVVIFFFGVPFAEVDDSFSRNDEHGDWLPGAEPFGGGVFAGVGHRHEFEIEVDGVELGWGEGLDSAYGFTIGLWWDRSDRPVR